MDGVNEMSELESYNHWLKTVREIRLPHWDELPNFDLYMDQVVALLTGYTGPLGMDPVTPTMINNYVKQKAVVAPTKKNYQVMQVADILLITLLKQSFPIVVIRSGIDRITATDYPKQAYDRFIDIVNQKIARIGMEHTTTVAKNLAEQLMQVTSNMIVDQVQTGELIRLLQKSVEHKPTKLK